MAVGLAELGSSTAVVVRVLDASWASVATMTWPRNPDGLKAGEKVSKSVL